MTQILQVAGKAVAFGLDWHVTLSSTSIPKAVRKFGGKYYWSASGATFFGVTKKTFKEKLVLPVLAANVLLANRYPEGAHLAILEIDNIYCVLATIGGKPVDGFDHLLMDEESVGVIVNQFKDRIDSFKLLTNFNFPNALPINFDDLVLQADSSAELKKYKTGLVNPVTMSLGVLVLILLGQVALTKYQAYKANKQIEEQANQTQSAQALYDEFIAAKSNEPTVTFSHVPSYLTEIFKLPSQIGGFRISKISCDIQVAQTSCLLSSDITEARSVTFQRYKEEANRLKLTNHQFSNDLRSVKSTLLIDNRDRVVFKRVLESAQKRDDVVVKLGSQIQSWRTVATAKLADFGVMPLPPHINVGALTSPPFKAMPFSVRMPGKAMGILNEFPLYVAAKKISIDIGNTPNASLNGSFIDLTVEGTIYAQ